MNDVEKIQETKAKIAIQGMKEGWWSLEESHARAGASDMLDTLFLLNIIDVVEYSVIKKVLDDNSSPLVEKKDESKT